MATPTDEALIERWRGEPAPLLGLLHAFHDRDGYLSETALRAVAQGLRIPLADLYGTVTFYHHLAREPQGRQAPRVCTGPVCCLRGGNELLAAQGATAMPCAGRCDEPVPVLQGHQVLVGTNGAVLAHRPTPLPPPNPGGIEECVFAEIRQPGRNTLAGYQRTGGYAGLTRAVTTCNQLRWWNLSAKVDWQAGVEPVSPPVSNGKP
jgi:NADH-quinone oxidoreductase subunit F